MKEETFYKLGDMVSESDASDWSLFPRHFHQDKHGDGEYFGYDKSSDGGFRYFLICDQYGWGVPDDAKKIRSTEYYSAYQSMVSSMLNCRDIWGTGEYFKQTGIFGEDIFYMEGWDGVVETVALNRSEIRYERDKKLIPPNSERITRAEYEAVKRKVISSFKCGKLPKRDEFINEF